MLSFHAWPLDISLKPSRTLKYVFYAFCMLAACIVCYSVWVSFYFLLVLPIFLLLMVDCYRRFVSLRHPEAVQGVSCKKGLWRLYTGEHDKGVLEKCFILDEFFLSRSLIVLSLKQHDAFFLERIIIFRDQLAPEQFQFLWVLLKFQRQDLLAEA